ncbi:hypothetical protein QN219_10550 [Sinorhizobium sp. 7-81]|uniref:hypothetical protein n=1 Tax=Sinorhizobium sp. 8-89 TaxID=3049089 RepID=UPI0024C31E38|nr:hypothetical protein [Sinorhizobium sp. 8-89]MDK1490498.1 hypothetical protein [Sinorhizobium sp. 8-89]
MIAFLTGPAGKALAVAAFVIALLGAGYWKGRSDSRVEQLKDTIAAIEKRERVDERVNGLDGIALCNELLGGGVHDECAQLRGVEEDRRNAGRRR